jgi:hypothetical protein
MTATRPRDVTIEGSVSAAEHRTHELSGASAPEPALPEVMEKCSRGCSPRLVLPVVRHEAAVLGTEKRV